MNIEQKILPVVRPYGRRLQRWMDNRLSDLTEQPTQSRLERAGERALVQARLALLYALEGRGGSAELWQGAAAGAGEALRVAFLGDAQSYKVNSPRYLRRILFSDDAPRVEGLGPLRMPAAREAAECHAGSVDLVIVEGNDRLRWQPGGGVWRWMPTWVRMSMVFFPGEPWEAVEGRMRGQKKNIRLAMREGYTCEVTQSTAAFDDFYERMYLPMMEDRHGEYGAVNRREELLPFLQTGRLLLVCKDGRAVAGALLHIRGRSAYGMVNGVLDGDKRWYQQGAVSRVYWQVARWCYENGITRFDAGGVRPFQTDGLYQFKSRWGFQPSPDVWLGRSWLFWARPGGPGEAWMREHPALKVEGVLESANLMA